MAGEASSLIGRQWPSLDLRAGALPYRLENGEPQFLLIRRRGLTGWAIPKGRLLAFRSPDESARLEAYQEAGVHGRVIDAAIGSYIHIKASPPHGRQAEAVEVVVFPMEVAKVEAQWPEMDVRERRWIRTNEAPQLVASGKLRDLIIGFAPALAPAAA